MLATYVRIALRNLWRDRRYAFINLGGLSIGIAAFLVILIFVAFETSFDRHHRHAESIFRVTRTWYGDDGSISLRLARISRPIGPALKRSFPEIEASVRLRQFSAPVRFEDQSFMEQRLFLVDTSYFSIFDADVLAGTDVNALAGPNTAVVTQELASKYFGKAHPIGKQLRVSGDTDVEIVGVMSAAPPTSHVHPDMLISMATADPWLSEQQLHSWGSFNNYATYIRLAPGADAAGLQQQLPAFLRDNYGPENNSWDELVLQPLTDIHLHSALDAELETNGNAAYVYLLLAVGIFVLLVASVNFVNLTTARSMHRAVEVGMRKTLGASPAQIVRQVLYEAVVMTLLSTLAAVLLAAIVIPEFSRFTGYDLAYVLDNGWLVAATVACIAFLLGIAAGSYPAFALSRFRPIHAISGQVAVGWKSKLRSALVVTQFTIAAVLVSGVIVVMKQTDYVQSKQLGFDKELLVALPAVSEIQTELPRLRERLLSSGDVESVTASRLIPSSPLVDHIGVEADVGSRMTRASLTLNPVDQAFVSTYGMDIVAGRDLDPSLSKDSTEAFLLNEAAVNAIGWQSVLDAVGSRFALSGNSLQRTGTVVGVVKDFHFESLRERIAPLVMFVMPERYRTITARLKGNNVSAELATVESVWREFEPDEPFRYTFIDQDFGALYETERRLGTVLTFFAGLAISIACLGLFGLAAFVTERRKKEIGIRKVLGASVSSVVSSLTARFVGHVLLAIAIATPATYLLVRSWLDGFAYHADPGAGPFLISALVILTVAVGSVGFESFRVAAQDPVASLRSD